MAILSSKQLTQLGDNFLLFAQAIGNYRYVNSGKLSPEQNQKIKDAQRGLLDYADDFYTTAATVIINDADVATALDTIDTVTQAINSTYQSLVKIQKALDVAAAGLTLASALFSQDPQAVGTAVAGLVKAWKMASPPKPSAA